MDAAKTLSEVHAALAQWALDALRAVDPETKRPLLTAAEASVIRAFLKDNEVTAPPETGSKIDELRKKLAERRAEAAAKFKGVNPVLDLGDDMGTMQ